MTSLQTAAAAWVALVLAVIALNVLVPQPFGTSALGAVFEPYLVLTGLMAGIVLLRAPSMPARVLALVLIAIAVPRYIPAWSSFPAQPEGERLHVSTLNILAGDKAFARAAEGISRSNADLVALQELELEVATALADQAGYEFHAMAAQRGVSDVGLLSRYPILENQTLVDLPGLRIVVDPPRAAPIVVYVVHPPLARLVAIGDVRVGLDFSVRDVAMVRLRAHVERDLAQGRSVIVMGDFNTTEREQAYAVLAAGLRDAHLDAGGGPGFTWRPSPVSFVPTGMLRIDYVLMTPDLIATSASVDCSVRSDHCRVDAELRMTR